MVFVAGSSVICAALNAPPATVLRHVAGLMACAAGVSTSGSSRQKPLAASAVHRWRKGLPVAGLMALPLSTRPPAGVVSPVANCEDVCCAKATANEAKKIVVKAMIRSLFILTVQSIVTAVRGERFKFDVGGSRRFLRRNSASRGTSFLRGLFRAGTAGVNR